MKVLVTGAKGFIGKNLVLHLKANNFDVSEYDINSTEDSLTSSINECDFIVHLAGINRPLTIEEFYNGNSNFTKHLVDLIEKSGRKIPLIFSSSTHAEKDNDYGKSKKMAEDYLFDFQNRTGNPVYIYRLTNVFGKWCNPNYNSACATFCYNIAHNLPIQISDRNIVISFIYIDDICNEFIKTINMDNHEGSKKILSVHPLHDCSLGHLADLLYSFKEFRDNLSTPSIEDPFERKLYATYLSYLPENEFAYDLNMHIDNRGSFTEFLKTPFNGQVSVNVGKPGIVKGNHYHHTKSEKFLTVSGTCSIKFRKVGTDKVIEYIVSGDKLQVVDIPTGYTHSITNIGNTDSVTIMWANEPFDPNNPDTYFEEVIQNGK